MQVYVLQDSAIQSLDLPRIIACTLVADAEVNLDPFHRLRKMGVSAVARLGVTL